MSDISQSTDSIREELENGNLDAPVSGAGATQTDIETGVDNSTTGSTVATNLDAKVSQAGQGVDWSSKASDDVSVGYEAKNEFIDTTVADTSTATYQLISGSGFLVAPYSHSFAAEIEGADDNAVWNSWDASFVVDGTRQFIYEYGGGSYSSGTITKTGQFNLPPILPFSSSLEFRTTVDWDNSNSGDYSVTLVIRNDDSLEHLGVLMD